MEASSRLFVLSLSTFVCATAFPQQCVHIHTPHPIPIPPPQAHAPLLQAQAPTPINYQWEREKMRLQHQYRMREISGGKLPEDDIKTFGNEHARRWRDAKGKSLVAKLVSFDRKTNIVNIQKTTGLMHDPPKILSIPLNNFSKDDQLYILKAVAR
jgi:hypothetical protein